jgi:hypothetical protein
LRDPVRVVALILGVQTRSHEVNLIAVQQMMLLSDLLPQVGDFVVDARADELIHSIGNLEEQSDCVLDVLAASRVVIAAAAEVRAKLGRKKVRRCYRLHHHPIGVVFSGAPSCTFDPGIPHSHIGAGDVYDIEAYFRMSRYPIAA